MQEKEMSTSKLKGRQNSRSNRVNTTCCSYVISLNAMYFLLIGFLSCNRTVCNPMVSNRTVRDYNRTIR